MYEGQTLGGSVEALMAQQNRYTPSSSVLSLDWFARNLTGNPHT